MGLMPGRYRYSQIRPAITPGTTCGMNSASWKNLRAIAAPESSSSASASAPPSMSGM